MNVMAMVLDCPSQSIGLETFHPRTDRKVTTSVAVHHPVRELPMAETLLRCSIKLHHVQVKYCCNGALRKVQ
jgi:hypothetical protein